MPGPAEPDSPVSNRDIEPQYGRTVDALIRFGGVGPATDVGRSRHDKAMRRRSELVDDGDGVRVSGDRRASPSVLEELRGVRVVTQSLETVLQGPVADQAELIGMINRLQGLGVELRGIRQLGNDAADPPRNPTDRHLDRAPSCWTTRSGWPARSGPSWPRSFPGSA